LLDELHQQTSGLDTEADENGSQASNQQNGTNTSQAQDPASDIGKPTTPEPSSPEPGTETTQNNGGAGNPPPTTPVVSEPPEPGPGNVIRVVTYPGGGSMTSTVIEPGTSLVDSEGNLTDAGQIVQRMDLAGQFGFGSDVSGIAPETGSTTEVNGTSYRGLPERESPLDQTVGEKPPPESARPPTSYNPPGAPTSVPPSGTPFPGESQTITGWQKVIFISAAAGELINQLEPLIKLIVRAITGHP
jgi:hypothetical protein